MKNKFNSLCVNQYDDDLQDDSPQVGIDYGNSNVDFMFNKIGFGVSQLEKLPLKVFFDVKEGNKAGKVLCSLYLAVEVNGKEYQLTTTNKKDFDELLKVLFKRFGGKYYEQ